jgi:hypothetical protein
MDNITTQDLISLAYDQKPIEFQNAFNTLISDRIAQAVDVKKIEVAMSMFSDQNEEEINSEEELEIEEPTDGQTT